MKREQFFRYTKRLLYKNIWLFFPLSFLVPGLVSCGGGGSNDVLAGGGIGGTGNTSVGPITALGSIFVNGIEFQTANAAVTINGVNSNEKELQIGMVVKVEGTVNADGKTGKADKVIFESNTAGPINSIDLGKSTLEVMGQTVVVDTQTIIVGLPGNTRRLADFAAEDMVEISGLADADGNIIATRIALKNTSRQTEVNGRVSALTDSTFKINALTVDYSKATLSKFGPSGIQSGDIAEVTGSLISPTILLADTIEKESSNFKEDNNIKCEGFIDGLYYTGPSISGFAIITQFGLQKVELNASTMFSAGNLIQKGNRVQVEGTFKNNLIQARKLELLESVKMKGSNATLANASLNRL
jgi:hypothetical protein